MANTTLPQDSGAPNTGAQFLETIQEARFRAGGPSSSRLLGKLVDAVQQDLSALTDEVADSVDTLRVVASALAAQEAGLARAFASLATRLSAVNFGRSSTMDLSLCERLDAGSTTADVAPLFGQAILPAASRQNVLVIESPGESPRIPLGAAIRLALQPAVTSSAQAVPPSDSAFGEDPYWPYAVDGDDRTFWPIEDPTSTPHMAWLEIDLPGDVSGAYRCNELEFVPFPLFATSLVAVQAEVIGRGWTDVDYTYLTGYDVPTGCVIGLGPLRLCFDRQDVRRFRLGLFVQGFWGVSACRVLNAVYQSPAIVAADFSADSPPPITNVIAGGKDPGALALMAQTVGNTHASITLSSTSASSTPVLTSLKATW